jgi:D-alanyl-D-alanine carboxypeptidase/D-alanyl-D-alanine-endopeptidase (penicillin-binding protein 4)
MRTLYCQLARIAVHIKRCLPLRVAELFAINVGRINSGPINPSLRVVLARLASRKTFSALLLTCAMASSGWARDTPLPPAVTRALQAQGIAATGLSVYAEDLNDGEVLLSHNAEQLRQPASTIKVLTTFVALDVLGPAFTWKTSAYANGVIKNGVLNGDLILVGGGDPYLTAERWWKFVSGIRQLGIKTITGDIVIDRSYFAPLNDNRAEFDSAPEKSYNVIPDALLVNFQTSQFTITGDIDNNKPVIMVEPLPANLTIDNQLRLAGKNCGRGYQGLRFATPQGASSNSITLSGSAAAGCGHLTVARAIMSPAEYAYGTFRTYFEQLGGHIDGKLRTETMPAKARLLLSYDSLTMGEIIRLVNKFSNNIMARTLLLTLGAEKYGAPATVEKGQRAISDWLTEHRIDTRGFVIDNGSGLSRIERTSAFGLASMLKVAWQSQFMPEFAASLPLSATDGTLRNRFQAAGMRGRIRMKTGHLEDVASLAGFVNAASGKKYVVVILVNHPGAQYGSGDEVQAAILRWVFGQ